MLDWGFTTDDIATALPESETIEEYDDGTRLVLGRAGVRPVHAVVRDDDGSVFVITVYEPEERRWDPTFRERRS